MTQALRSTAFARERLGRDQAVGEVDPAKLNRWGGAITAAKFLEEFVGDVPWTHIDIAGPAFAEKPKPWVAGGGSGAMVRTLVEVARGWK